MHLRSIPRAIGRGLLFVLPAAVTLYLIIWVGWSVEAGVGRLARRIPGGFYVPGMGLAAALLLTFLIGLLMQAALAQRAYALIETLLVRIPLVNTLYGSLRDLTDYFSGKKTHAMNTVVMVDILGDGRQRLLGFVTREQFDDLPPGIGEAGMVAVYMPMSYQLGGFTTVVPRSAVTPVAMTIEQAMRFALTAGVRHVGPATGARR